MKIKILQSSNLGELELQFNEFAATLPALKWNTIKVYPLKTNEDQSYLITIIYEEQNHKNIRENQY